MQIVSIEYRKPNTRQFDEDWDFTATVDETLPHGYPTLGGLLKHTANGQWTARHFRSTDWCAPAATRKQAVLNMIPAASAVIIAHKLTEAMEKDEQSRRIKVLQGIEQHLQKKMGDGLTIEVNGDLRPEKPFEKFSIEIGGLTLAQLELLVIAFEARK